MADLRGRGCHSIMDDADTARFYNARRCGKALPLAALCKIKGKSSRTNQQQNQQQDTVVYSHVSSGTRYHV